MITQVQQAAHDDQPTEEARLIAQALTRPADFAPLYARYFPGIYRYCLRRVGSPEEAEDLTSTVFVRALASLGSYRGGSVAAWLFQIAHRVVANHLRARRVRSRFGQFMHATADPMSSDSPLLDQLVRSEERQQLARLIAALPDQQRELLTLRVAHGLTAKEIGTIMGKSEGAIRVALHRIVQQLRAGYRHAGER